MSPETKLCTGCRLELPVESFTVHDKDRGYRKSKCKKCESQRIRFYYANNPEYRRKRRERAAKQHSVAPKNAETTRRHMLKHKYNMTPEQHDEILSAQGDCCALCGASDHRQSNGRGGNWPVDHDHKTGRVRGILCQPCNTSMGGYERLRDLVGDEQLAAYLHFANAPAVPLKEEKDKSFPDWLYQPSPTDEERFWSFVTKSEGCWSWSGSLMTNGYPYLSVEGGKQLCNRLAWKYTGRDLARGRKLINECGHRVCVNPDHWRSGTQAEIALMTVKNRKSRGPDTKPRKPRTRTKPHEETPPARARAG